MKTKDSTSLSKYDFSVCPECAGTGVVFVNETDTPEIIEVYGEPKDIQPTAHPCPVCKGGLYQKTAEAKKNSNIPMTFYDKNYSSFNWDIYRDQNGRVINTSQKRAVVENFIKNYHQWKQKGLGLYIYSKTKGSGKTFLSSCICNELMELYGIRTRFVNATNLLDISQSGDKTSPDEYKREPIKLLCNCELLVIDDLGQKRTGYDWMNEILYRIADDRMTQRLVTIYTSNEQIHEVALDDRTISRIDKTSIVISLPEYNVRLRESYDEKIEFLKEIGLRQ